MTSEEIVNPSEIVVGRTGRVVLVEDDSQTFHVRLNGGGIARVSSSAFVRLTAGDTVIISENGWHSVPNELWFDELSVGIVRKLYSDGVLLETSIGMRFLKKKPRKKLGLEPGNTVEYDDHSGVTRVLSKSPVRVRDIGVDDDVLSEYRVGKDEDSDLTFDSFGGYEDVVARTKELIETQLNRKDELDAIGANPVKGVIFTGPPGTGKTHLARIVANVSKATFFLVSGPSIVSKWVGDSEETLRRLFDAAADEDRAIIFFDEIDSIAARRGSDSNGESKRVVAQLLTLLDGFKASNNVVVIAATNRVEDIDEALLRPGRFDWEIQFDLPTPLDRYKILQVRAAKLATTGTLPLEELAELTEGWSGAMLTAIWTEAALLAAGDHRKAIADEDIAVAYERVSARPVRARAEVDRVA